MIAEQTRELCRQGIEFFFPRGAFGGLFAFALISAQNPRNPQEEGQREGARDRDGGTMLVSGRMGCCGMWEKVRRLLRRDKIAMSQLGGSEFVISDTRQIET